MSLWLHVLTIWSFVFADRLMVELCYQTKPLSFLQQLRILSTKKTKLNVSSLNLRLLLFQHWSQCLLKLRFVFYTAVWNSVYGFDMSCIKKKAMMEPLVDTVDQNQIVTDSKLLKVRYYTLTITSSISFTCAANADFILFFWFCNRQWISQRCLLVMLPSQLPLNLLRNAMITSTPL